MKKKIAKMLRGGKVTVLAVVVALTLAGASTAFAANGGNFILGQSNAATAITKLAGRLGVDGPMLRIDNNNGGSAATAMDLQVEPGKAPLTVNSDTRVDNLNADKLDGHDAECPQGTRLFLGACWEEERRAQADTVFNAMSECTNDGRYLPHVLESRAFAQRFRGSTDADVREWTQTVFSDNGGPNIAGIAVTRAGGTAVHDDQDLHPYRCVAPLVR